MITVVVDQGLLPHQCAQDALKFSQGEVGVARALRTERANAQIRGLIWALVRVGRQGIEP
ncbi:hypothetical protein OG216_25025 [Streptomycetaceae bacterium NBC_01309]